MRLLFELMEDRKELAHKFCFPLSNHSLMVMEDLDVTQSF